MKSAHLAAVLVGAATALAGFGLAGGATAAFVASPVALALLLLARSVSRSPGSEAPRRLVGAGLSAGGLSLLLALGGALGLAAATLAVAAVVLACAIRLALDLDPPPADVARSGSRGALWAGVGLDESLKLAAELRAMLRSKPDRARVASEVRAAADRNHQAGWLDHPERAHLPPPPLEKSTLAPRPVRTARHLEQLRFASEFEPLDPEIREEYLAVASNRSAVTHLCRHPGGPRPTLVLVHGYGMGHPALDLRAWDAAWLHETLGLDLALFVLPLHGMRSRGALSGQGFFDRHPLWTSAALGQAVWDLRRITGWLRARGAPAVGVAGMSLGGTVAALFASIEENLACAIAMLPVASLEAFAWQQLPPHARAAARAAGLSEHLLGEAWARNAPLRVRPRVPHEARLVVGARADRIVPPSQVTALWEHWGRPPVHWLPGTHLVWRGRDELRERLATHLRDTLIAAGSLS